MWPVRSTSSTQSGGKTRRPTTSSQFPRAWPGSVTDTSLIFLRHALREYDIHKKLDHPVSPVSWYEWWGCCEGVFLHCSTSCTCSMSLRSTPTRKLLKPQLLSIMSQFTYPNPNPYLCKASAQCWNLWLVTTLTSSSNRTKHCQRERCGHRGGIPLR